MVKLSESNDDTQPQSADRALAAFDEAKRATLRKLIIGAAFVVPVVASFSVDGVVSTKAYAKAGLGHSGGHTSNMEP